MIKPETLVQLGHTLGVEFRHFASHDNFKCSYYLQEILVKQVPEIRNRTGTLLSGKQANLGSHFGIHLGAGYVGHVYTT